MNEHASELGKMGKGVPRKYSAEEIDLRRGRLAAARERKTALRAAMDGEVEANGLGGCEKKLAEAVWRLSRDLGLGASPGDCVRAAKEACCRPGEDQVSRLMRALAVVSHAVETHGESQAIAPRVDTV